MSPLSQTTPAPPPAPGVRTDALAGGWDAFVTMPRWIALAFGAVLPFAVATALVVPVWARLARARRPVPGTEDE